VGVIEDLLRSLPARPIGLRDVRIGAFWTVVWTELGAGMAATQQDSTAPHGESLVRWAGDLLTRSAQELADLLRSGSPMEASLGMAAVNALLTVDERELTDRNAAEVLVERGAGKRVAVVGHFPFVARLGRVARHLDVLELRPGPGELPSEEAGAVLPQADVVALTGTSLLNRTFDTLVAHCRPDAFVLVLGPTTPLASRLFDHGIDMIAGARVTEPAVALAVAGQGAIFRQMQGIQLVTMVKATC
jgi:uncharacterized protein (DUF4213/DUF364 family)